MNKLAVVLKNGVELVTPGFESNGSIEKLIPAIINLKETNGKFALQDDEREYIVEANDIDFLKILF